MLLNAGLDALLRWGFISRCLCGATSINCLKLKPLAVLVLAFIFEDLCFTLSTGLITIAGFFWAVHVTHHSSEEFNLSTGFRSSVLQPVYRFIYLMPLALLGFNPLDIVLCIHSLKPMAYWCIHNTSTKCLPGLKLFVSPSHHRVHHANNVIYLDKNMGMCLIIWDKLFGTFQNELEEEPVKYGLTKPLDKKKRSSNKYNFSRVEKYR